MLPQKLGARAEYRQQESLRIQESASLAAKFPQLTSLAVDLTYFNPEGVSKSSHIKYTVNLANAKSVFSFSCPNTECVRGDFDLSDDLAGAIAARQTTVTGEARCHGWRSKTTIDTLPCHNLLRYTLKLAY